MKYFVELWNLYFLIFNSNNDAFCLYLFHPKDISVNTQRWQRFYFDIHLLWILNVLFYNYFYSNQERKCLDSYSLQRKTCCDRLSTFSHWALHRLEFLVLNITASETLVVFLSSLVSNIRNISASKASLETFSNLLLLFLQSFSLDHL